MRQVPSLKGPISRVTQFRQFREERRLITMVTAYDYCSARLVRQSAVDCILVGDSAAMVMHGHKTTVMATLELMEWHTAAVRRGAGEEIFIVADIPFPWHRYRFDKVLTAVDRLMKAGANAVKIEGAGSHLDTIRAVVESGVPVMGHLGLTPQSVHQFGGYKVQGRDEEAARKIVVDFKGLESAGCFAVVLECVPSGLASAIRGFAGIPTIGIGSGADCDGQVLVWQDLLGMQDEFKPKFVRRFANVGESVVAGLNAYVSAVQSGDFPNNEESYS